jgi:hypothetical protein
VVGYPAWANVNFEPAFLGYRLAIWQFPLTAGLLFAFLTLVASRRGWDASSASLPRPHPPDSRPADRSPESQHGPGATIYGLAHLVPPGCLVAITASCVGHDPERRISLLGIAVGVLYVAGVGAAAWMCRLLRAGSLGATTPRDTVASLNVVATPTVICLSLWWFAHTTTTVSGAGSREWEWIPLWLALLVAICTTTLIIRGMSRRLVPVRLLERQVVAYGVGAALVFVLTSALPGPAGTVEGFDDMMGVAGAEQIHDGAFPWRDLLMVHGIFEDALRSMVGFELFGHTVWGARAAYTALWIPLGWVGVYVLGNWVARSRGLAPIALLLTTVALSTVVEIPPRWVLAAPVFLLMGIALRRPERRWTSILTTALFAEAVLVPEALLQVLAVALVLVLVDLRGRGPGPWWRAPNRFLTFVLTGLACSVLFAGYLALHSALDDFYGYYRIFGPGHVASGFLPIGPYAPRASMLGFVVSSLLVGATLCWAWVTAVRRKAMTSSEWLILTSAILAALYGEKALGRFDSVHINQSVAVTMPLVVVWVGWLLPRLDSYARVRLLRIGSLPRVVASSLASVLLSVLVVVVTPSTATSVWRAPAHNVAAAGPAEISRLGFAEPEAFDVGWVSDLRSIIDALAGPDAKVFDFSNSPGVFYYLLRERSPTSYYHVSMAIPEAAQRGLIKQLERTRPEIVAFDATRFGLSAWDSVVNPVRHFLVSQYVLDGWKPVVKADGVLLMLRNDLVRTSGIRLPQLGESALTTHLHSAVPTCDWGNVPGFLATEAVGPRVRLDVTDPVPARELSFTGWTYGDGARTAVQRVVVAVGPQVVGTLSPTGPRRDLVARLHEPGAASAGFSGTVATTVAGRAEPYAILADGSARPIRPPAGDAPERIFGQGESHPVIGVPLAGEIEQEHRARVQRAEITLPSEMHPGAYSLATFRASSGPIGPSRVTLYGTIDGEPGGGSIRFTALPDSRSSAGVPVGSCLQWHGFETGRFFIVQRGGHPIDSVTLSHYEPR